MLNCRWETHEWDIVQKMYVKVSEGTFNAPSLRAAKMKATRQSLILRGDWRLTSASQAIALTGRVYLKQVPSRPDYENLNTKLYLFIL